MALDEVPLLLSFKTDRAGRPRWANQMWVFNTFGDMLDLDALSLTLPGIEFEGIKAPRSALMTYALKQLQAQALAIAFNVFRCAVWMRAGVGYAVALDAQCWRVECSGFRAHYQSRAWCCSMVLPAGRVRWHAGATQTPIYLSLCCSIILKHMFGAPQ